MAQLRAKRAAAGSSNANTTPSKRGSFGTDDSGDDDMGPSSRGGKGKASAGGLGVDSDEEEEDEDADGGLVGAKRSRSDYDEVWEIITLRLAPCFLVLGVRCIGVTWVTYTKKRCYVRKNDTLFSSGH